VPLEKYQAFFEGMVDHAVMFKDELAHRKDLILQRQLEEEAMRQAQERIKRGRMRINAHPTDVKRDLEKQTISQVLNQGTNKHLTSSQSISKTPNNNSSTRNFNLESSLENAIRIDQELDRSEDGVHHSSEITLPSIFNNKKFEKELPSVELKMSSKDYLKTNQNLLDLNQVKSKNKNIFNEKSDEFYFNNSYSTGINELSRSKLDPYGNSNRQLRRPANILLDKSLRTNRTTRVRQLRKEPSNAAYLSRSLIEKEKRAVSQRSNILKRERSVDF